MEIFQAIRTGQINEIEKYFIDGGESDISDENDCSPLRHVKHPNVLHLLLSYNVDINTKDTEEESTVLHRAADCDNIYLVHTALVHGANPNDKTIAGNTPLHLATIHGYHKIVELLLLYGADPTKLNNVSMSPLHMAIEGSHSECIRLLGKMEDIALMQNENEMHDYIDGEILNSCSTDKKLPSARATNIETEEQNRKFDEQIHHLKYQKIDLNMSTEKKEKKKMFAEMKTLKRGMIVDRNQMKEIRKELEDCQRDIDASDKRLSELAKSIIKCDKSVLMLEKSKCAMLTDSGNDKVDEKEYECPVCFEIPLPPVLIYQCNEGHIYCSVCKDKPNMKFCPQCRQLISNSNNRNRVMEKMIQSRFGVQHV